MPSKLMPPLIEKIIPLDEVTSYKLSKVKQSNTSAEIIVRKIIHGLGIRYRIKNKDLPGSPDLANRQNKWVVFVNGCFWHHHENCKKATIPKNNQTFWLEKFARNKQRDLENNKRLMQDKYAILTIWECEFKDKTKLERKVQKFFKKIYS